MSSNRHIKKYWYNKIIVILLVLSITLFSNCEKIQYKKVRIKGVFWDYCRESPLQNFKIQIVEGKQRNYETTLINETTTDANGCFDFGEISIKKNDSRYYHIYAVYNSGNDMLTSGVGDVEPYNIKNTDGLYINMQNKKQVLENKIFTDTIRSCSYNYNKGKFCFSSIPNPDNGDSLTIKLKSKYFDKQIGSLDLHNIDNKGCKLLKLGTYDCGKYLVRFEKKKNGIVSFQEDTIELKWKTDIAFECYIDF